jgi:hypothetical protein
MKKSFFYIIAMGFALLAAAKTSADVPSLIPVQGTLTDTADVPIDGSFDMRFAIFTAEQNGTELWFENRTGGDKVEVKEGFFTVYLGEVSPLDPLDFIDYPQLWLEMRVGDETMGRTRLAAEPFAFESVQLGSLGEEDVQPILDEACATGSYLRGWDAEGSARARSGKPRCRAGATTQNPSSPRRSMTITHL